MSPDQSYAHDEQVTGGDGVPAPGSIDRQALGLLLGQSLLAAVFLLVLARLTLTQTYSFEHGSFLAVGRQILASGIPEREFFLPLLADQPFSSPWLLGAAIFALFRDVAGPGGLTALKALCYGGTFATVAWASWERGARFGSAVLLAGLGAIAASPLFMENMGMFSALLLAVVGWVWAVESPSIRARWMRCVLAVPIFGVWPFLDTAWYIGILAAACFLVSEVRKPGFWWLWPVGWLATPFILFAWVHPAGVAALICSLDFLPAFTADAMTRWREMPFAVLVLLALAWASVPYIRGRYWAEGSLLVVLVLLTLAHPANAAAAMVAGLPLLTACIPPRAEEAVDSIRGYVAGAAVLLLVLWGSLALNPSARPGLGVPPELDTRGVGDVLLNVAEREGAILAAGKWSSLLLSNPGAARQGVVIDARRGVYTHEYLDEVVNPLFDGEREQWRILLREHRVTFYYEPHEAAESLAGRLGAIGWVLVAWDNSGRLWARPDVVERWRLPRLLIDPARLEIVEEFPVEAVALAEREVLRHVGAQEIKGIPTQRGRIVHARLALMAGHHAMARQSLRVARDQGAERWGEYWETLRDLEMATGNTDEAEHARRMAERLSR